MNDVKIDGFLLEDGVIQNWTGWYFDDIGSGQMIGKKVINSYKRF